MTAVLARTLLNVRPLLLEPLGAVHPAPVRDGGDIANLGPSWSLAPSQNSVLIRRHPETGGRRLDLLKWGLVPHFTKNLKKARKPINARGRDGRRCASFRGAFAAKRCILPAGLFYEWQKIVTAKQPYAIARADETQLAFDGSWEG